MISFNNLTEKIPDFIKNKYFAAIFLFIIWIIFIDTNNLIKQYKFSKKIENLEDQKLFYLNEIIKDSLELNNIMNDSSKREKFAREKFLMKKENEDVYIIRKKINE